MDAQGNLDSLLGRLTNVLLNEAQLLGGVRSDVEYIKDEMESMNGLLLHLTEAQHRDHQVRAWMKQVAGLSRDCEGNVELYIHYVGGGPGGKGIIRYLRRIARFFRTIPVRHQIAMRIRELKVRARDIADRRHRYGVTVPELAMAGTRRRRPWVAVDKDEDFTRRAVLDGAAENVPDDEEIVKKGIDLLIKQLSKESVLRPTSAPAKDGRDPGPRIFPLIGDRTITKGISKGVYDHFSKVGSFDCMVWVDGKHEDDVRQILARIITEVSELDLGSGSVPNRSVVPRGRWPEEEDEEKRAAKLQELLKGKRFLIILTNVENAIWIERERIRSALLLADGCSHGSAIIMNVYHHDKNQQYSQDEFFETSVQFFTDKAMKLVSRSCDCGDEIFLWNFIRTLHPDTFAMKMLLHLLYAQPHRTQVELRNYWETISECKQLNRNLAWEMLKFSYNELPSKYRSCLLSLAIFPQGHIIKTASLARRWIAEGLIAHNTGHGIESARAIATDEADYCLDVLATRGFVCPMEMSIEGNIKRCTVHREVHEFITWVARDVNFVDVNLPKHWAHRLSIHNRIGFHASDYDGDSKDIVYFLPSLEASSQWQLLKVLDLEGCKGLKKHHLQSICKILLLKYLSLRNTDVVALPKQIKDLQCLETLDIRQTKIRALAEKAIVFPLLKYFLAGRRISASNYALGSEGSSPTVHMPLCIQRMKNLETMSHVHISNCDTELAGITQLLKLRKLGVTLDGENARLNELFHHIEKLHSCLRILSIQIDPKGSQNAGITDASLSPPQFIESLSISGITSGLPHLIQELHQLAKITITESFLLKDGIRILGKLKMLQCLKLLYNSYARSKLKFKAEEFQNLRSLVVKGSNITRIIFDTKATPELKVIIWSFSTLKAFSGVNNLLKLKKVELNGDCNVDLVRAAIEKHPNNPILKHNPYHQNQKEGTAAAASPSSAL
ncbi:hypothetical protein ACP4OV_002018 [Aristida adscensionis]